MKTAFKNLIFFMLFLNINTGVLNAEMKVSMSPPTGQVGATFANSGSGFTPNHTVTLMRRMPNGSVQAVARVRTDSSGSFSATWTAKTPGNNFAWWAVDDATGKKSENEVVYGILSAEHAPAPLPQPATPTVPSTPTNINPPPIVTPTPQPPIASPQPPQPPSPMLTPGPQPPSPSTIPPVPPKSVTQGDTQKLKVIADEIQSLRKEMMDGKYKLPEYLPGTSGKIPAIVGGFGTKDYDKYWYEAKSYHDSAQQQLKQASDFVRSGNVEGAMNSLNQAKQSLQKFLASVSASATTWDSQLAKAERIAKVAQTAADLSLSTLAQLVPGASPLVQQFLLARNIYFDSKMYGITEATKNAIVTIAVGKVFENSLPGGRPVKGLGDVDLSLLARRLKEDGGFRGRITQEVAKSLKGEIATDIIQEITLKASNELAIYLESIAPPVKQIPTQSTGHTPPPTPGPRSPQPPPVQPPPATKPPSVYTPPPPVPARTLRVGVDAIVSNTYENGRYIGLKLRSGTGLNAPKIGNIPEGTRVKITEGPISRDGYTWWRVESPYGKGWCAGNWLTPAP